MTQRVHRACALLAVGTLLAACGGNGRGQSATPSPTPTSIGTAKTPTGSPSRSVKPSPGRQAQSFLPKPYLPLWPFASMTEIETWRGSGTDPWHRDAQQTALYFVRDYLGFRGIDRIVSSKVTGTQARINVGYRSEEGGKAATAAVLHLVRIGSGDDRVWEVVGTDDSSFSLTAPGYGSTVSSPVTVGGRITGVDESIQVRMYAPASTGSVGRYCCQSAGGTKAPWSAQVAFTAGTGQVLTIAAWTGGHVADVERFAVTGVRS